jgi:hypothetical protein
MFLSDVCLVALFYSNCWQLGKKFPLRMHAVVALDARWRITVKDAVNDTDTSEICHVATEGEQYLAQIRLDGEQCFIMIRLSWFW